ncbi:unnamed protein product [Allacma fusca]|uniref:SnoaL-like domain-containing protein n=1 Tax=Allacma fusca TaxID=39272 RepID=A0A8J2LNE3_9HEXA|nr:unnamed protein product [Allacma fusca]
MRGIILCAIFGVISASAVASTEPFNWRDWAKRPSIIKRIGALAQSELAKAGHGPGPSSACQPVECPESRDRCKFSPEKNKEVVLDFYSQVFVLRNFSVVDAYYDPDILQHNPYIGDGKKPFMEYIVTSKVVPFQIFRPVADCDLVYLHVKTEDDRNKPLAIVDIFRLDCGTIVEHWDVAQEIPGKSANPRAMF